MRRLASQRQTAPVMPEARVIFKPPLQPGQKVLLEFEVERVAGDDGDLIKVVHGRLAVWIRPDSIVAVRPT